MSKVKKILSIAAAAAIVGTMFSFATISSSAFSGEIKWEAPSSQWQKANKIAYAHIWNSISGEGVSGWQTAEEKMTDNGDGTYSYNVPEGDWNLIIISGSSGYQTYDTTFSTDCIGDTMHETGENIENPVDSTKQAIGASWKNHSSYGPHKCISSLGKVIGTSLATGETNQTLYDNFCRDYAAGTSHPWDDDGAITTGKSFDQIKAEIRTALGLSDDSSSTTTSDSGSDTLTSGSDSSTASTSGSGSTSSKASSSASTSSTSTGSTTTGDSTPYIALGVILVAALGVAVVARKKISD